MTGKINVLQTGSVYFFYRPKVTDDKEVQRFFLVLRPHSRERYYLLVIGKKQLPATNQGSYFAFVEAIKREKNDLLQSLNEKHYSTATRGERTLPVSHCLGIGKFLLVVHNNHTHFVYQLTSPKTIKPIQEEFNLQKEDDYLISVKNPQASTPIGIGLSEKQKVNYPFALQEKFANYRFIPLTSPEFLDYERTELLLISQRKKNLVVKEKEAEKCLEKINPDNLLDEFAKIAPPEAIAAKILDDSTLKLNASKDIIEVEILNKKQIEKNKMGLLLAVNAGSHHEPRVVILRYLGDKENQKDILGLVGKGITFDSGGYNLKSSQYLECMKFDMSGAAAVCASFLALIKKKPKINVVAVACLTENAIGGHATLTESVITSMSGKSVEINNTDAEGRLVLADGITYAIQKEKVNKIVTVATLTGAVVAALGENLTENTRTLKENTSIADISNIGSSRYMGASNGAAFLQEFVEKLPFIHCDIAGTA
nr:7927_t:CDS:2 [Entrophospora candida]